MITLHVLYEFVELTLGRVRLEISLASILRLVLLRHGILKIILALILLNFIRLLWSLCGSYARQGLRHLFYLLYLLLGGLSGL